MVSTLVFLHWRKKPETSGWIFALVGFVLGFALCIGTPFYLWYTSRWWRG